MITMRGMNNVMYTPEQVATTNEINVVWDAFGEPSNPALLLIAGLGVQLTDWDEQLCSALARLGLYVIRFDNRDIGRSSGFHDAGRPYPHHYVAGYLSKTPITAPYTLQDMAQDTIGLLDALNIDQAHLLGVSMGGMIAQLIAIEHHERVLSLTSIMSTTGERDLPGVSWKLALPRLQRPFPVTEAASIRHTVGVLMAMNGSVHGETAERLTELLRISRERNQHPQGKERHLWAVAGTAGRREKLRQLNIPTLVIHGDEDPLLPVACGIDTAAAIPNAKLVIVEGLGHCMPRSINPQIVAGVGTMVTVRRGALAAL